MTASKKFWTPLGGITRWTDVEKMEKLFRRPKRGFYPRWVFRAKRLSQDLKTKLEERFELNGIRGDRRIIEERKLIRRFQRKASLYLDHEPDKDDILEWLAVMRHHGALTRLLDWTYSFYVAVYLALGEKAGGVVWALNAAPISRPEPMIKRICDQKDGFRKFSKVLLHYLKQCDFLGIRADGDKLIDLAVAAYLIDHPFPCVYPVNPFRLNRRLSVQQGLFLMVGDIRQSFSRNLTVTFGGSRETQAHLWRLEITPSVEERKEILRRLRDMNISNEALFPGLDGFARSVGEGLAYPRVSGDGGT